MAGLLQPGPTLVQAEELRKRRGSRGLLEAVGEPMSYAPNPAVAALGQGLLGLRYLTGEKDMGEGMASLSDMTATAVGSRLPPAVRNVIRGMTKAEFDALPEDLRSRITGTDESYRLPNLAQAVPQDYLPAATRLGLKEVTIYRGVPDNIPNAKIRPGDWVALDPKYAKGHGTGATGKSKLLKQKVPADHVGWAGTDMNEYFYVPRISE